MEIVNNKKEFKYITRMDLFAQIHNEIVEFFDYDIDIKLVSNRGMYRLYEIFTDEQSYIARICHPEQQDEVQRKIIKETEILKGDVRTKDIPIPRIIHSNIDEENSYPYYLIMEKMDGIPLVDLWHHLSETDKISIASELGDFLNQIHDIEYPFFGEIGNLEKYKSWRKFLKLKMMKSLDHLYLNKAIKRELFIKSKFFVSSHWGTIPEMTHGKLVHNDLNGKNILIDMSEDLPKISGIIDWEMSFSGEPSYDLTQIDSLFHNNEKPLSAFFYNYDNDPRKDNQWYYRRKIYLLDKFIQNAYYHYCNGKYNLQRRKLTEFMLDSILRFVNRK